MLDFKGRCLTGYDRWAVRGHEEQSSEAEASKPMRFILLICYCLISALRQLTLFLSTSVSPTWKCVLLCAAVFSGKREPTDLLVPFTAFPTSSQYVGLAGLRLCLCAHPLFPSAGTIFTAVRHPDPSLHGLMQRGPSCSGKAFRMVTIQTPLWTRALKTGGRGIESPGEVGGCHRVAPSSNQCPHALCTVAG